jgi:hypothetical protein
MRGEAALTLGMNMAYGLSLMAAATLMGSLMWPDDWPEFSVEWDPSSTDFGKLKIGKTRLGLFGDNGPYIRAIMQTVWPTKKSQAGRKRDVDYFSFDERSQPIKQLMRNKRAPLVDLLSKIWTGRTFYGGEAFPKDKSIKFHIGKEAYERFAPFFIAGAIEAGRNDGIPIGALAGIQEFFSGQALSYEPSTRSKLQITQDIAAINLHNKLWDDLTPRQQNRIYNQVPRMEELELQISKERGDLRPEQLDLSKSNRVARRITSAMPEDVRKELRATGVQIPGLGRTISKFYLNDARYATYQQYATQEIQKELTRRIEQSGYQRRTGKNRQDKLKDYISDAKTKASDRVMREIKRGQL